MIPNKRNNMKNIKILTIIILIFSMCAITACGKSSGNGSNERIIVAGSSSVQPYAELLAEAYELIFPESKIDIQGGGSAAGISSAEAGIADVGMSSRDLKDNDPDLWYTKIATDGLAIIVNPRLTGVNNLTKEQIRDIYTGKITNWRELNGPDAQIYVITREEGSGTRTAFEDLVMGKDSAGNPIEISHKAIVQNSNGAVRLFVSDDINFIGFISLGLVEAKDNEQKEVKALQMDGIEPTAENVRNGSYKLSRPFLFLTHGNHSVLTRNFITYILSEAGQKLLTDEGLVSILPEERQQILNELDILDIDEIRKLETVDKLKELDKLK